MNKKKIDIHTMTKRQERRKSFVKSFTAKHVHSSCSCLLVLSFSSMAMHLVPVRSLSLPFSEIGKLRYSWLMTFRLKQLLCWIFLRILVQWLSNQIDWMHLLCSWTSIRSQRQQQAHPTKRSKSKTAGQLDNSVQCVIYTSVLLFCWMI